MNTSALIVMLGTMLLVTGMAVYFFMKVVKAPPKPEPDSFLYNDDEDERREAS